MVFISKKRIAAVAVTFLLLGQFTPVFAQLAAQPITEPVAPADTTGPTFTSIEAVSVLPDGLTVVWTMDEAATSYVEYGLTENYGSATPDSATASLEGTAVISGLAAGTKYHYRVVAKDIAGNISYSADHTSVTAAEPIVADNEPPVIAEVGVTAVATSTATIAVFTDELSRVRVEYGPTENYGLFAVSGEEFSLNHAVTLANLLPDTLYHYRVIAEDETGNVAISFDNDFTTGALAVSEPATTVSTSSAVSGATSTSIATATSSIIATTTFTIIDPLAASISASTTKIIWTTTEPATSQVVYGVTSAYGSSTAEDENLTTSHSILLAGLLPGTDYLYGVRSKTADGKRAALDNLEFTTLPALAVSKPPRISNVKVSRVGTSTATIVWTASTPTRGDLRYGTSTSYGSSAGKHTVLLVDHLHEVVGLSPGTEYHYQAFISDEKGNSSVSEDRSFRTASLTGESGVTDGISPNENTVILPDPPDTAPPPVMIGGAAPPTPLPKPKLVKAEALEGQVLFVFNKTSANERIRIVRRNWVSPKNAWDGRVVYEGVEASFADTGLVNEHTYHYGVYRIDQFRGVSKPILLAATPLAGKDQVQFAAGPVPAPKTPRFVFSEDIKPGDSGRDVKHLQLLLAADKKLYPQALITGYFGPLTKAALARFQKSQGLSPTGVAGKATRQKLEVYSTLRYLPEGTLFFSRDLSLGSGGEDVAALQQWLSKNGYYPESIFSGYFGRLTKNAVAKFQADNGIVPANGYFGPLTRGKAEELR